MTVESLIEKLKAYDPHTKVEIFDDYCGYVPLEPANMVQVLCSSEKDKPIAEQRKTLFIKPRVNIGRKKR